MIYSHPSSQGRLATSLGGTLLLLVSSTSAAQTLDTEELLDVNVLSPSQDRAARVHWADLDGDGDLDPVFVQGTDAGPRTAWAENLSDGTFGSTRLFDSSAGPGWVSGAPFGADLDMDGDVDVIVTYLSQSDAPHVGWLENIGGGSFAPQVMLTPSDSVDIREKVAVLDLDGDGDQDFVTGTYGGQWYENLGGLVFAAASPLLPVATSTQGLPDLATGDLDGDGLIEVYFAATYRGIYRLEGDGLGGVAPATLVLPVPATDFATAVAVGDVDGDGDDDLVSEARPRSGSNLRTVTLHENDGSGALSPRTWSVNEEVHMGLHLADVDENGLLDLVRYDLVTYTFLVSFQTVSSPSLGLATSVTGPAPSRPSGVVDANQDGHVDLWMASSNFGIAFGTGTGSFSPLQPLASRTQGGSPAVAGDMDGDGTIDLVVMHGLEANILFGQPNGAFVTRVGPSLAAGSVGAPTLADVDGDGDLDVAVGTGHFPEPTAALQLFENLGDSFGSPTTITSDIADGGQRALFGDADGDGDVDLFWSYYGFQSLPLRGGWAMNDGAGAFTPSTQFALEPQFKLLGLEDLDGDGADDVIYVRQAAAGALMWRRTLPGGLLAPAAAVLPLTGLSPQSVAPVVLDDLDGDGRVDLVALSPNWNETRVYAGLVGGGFAPAVPAMSQTVAASHVVTLDADGDGLRDVLVLGMDGGQLARGLGGFTFAPPETIPAGVLSLDHVSSADVDRDGDDDLLIRSIQGVGLRRSNLNLGVGFCTPTANSTGAPAQLRAAGSRSVAANALRLQVQGLPTGQFGIFIMSDTTGFLPGLSGTPGVLCLDPTRISRLIGPGQILVSSASGTVALDLNLPQIPTGPPIGPLAPGDTRYFQYWTRDGAAGTANLSSGLGVAFTR